MTQEALKLALEALEWCHGGEPCGTAEAITAIKAALAQPAPQQEPVAWMDIDEKGSASGLRYWSEPDNRHEVALYTTPPQRTWVGLNEDERKEAWWSLEAQTPTTFVQAIEAKLKEKNT